MTRFDVSDLIEANEQDPIEVRQLKKRFQELLHMLEEGQILELTNKDKFLIRVGQVSDEKPSREQEIKAFWADVEQLATQIGAKWQDHMSAVDAVRDVRRDL